MEKGGLAVWAFGELDALRRQASETVTRFCEITGIPRATWYRWRSASSSSKGPWPTPAQDAVEADAKTLAADWESWGHRKLAALKRAGIGSVEPGPVSDSTMHRVLARNALALPANHTAQARRLADARKEAFTDPPARQNRLWQADISEFETNGAGTWNLGGVVDYWAKTSLACEITVAKTAADAIVFPDAALAEVDNLLGITWTEDLADPDTGEIGTLKLVTDNGPCFKSARFASWAASKRHIAHIRTRHRAPWTNGVIERFFGAIKYEHLYRRDIDNGIQLAAETDSYRTTYNSIRPHEAIAMARPLDRYRQTPTTQPRNKETVSNSLHGTAACSAACFGWCCFGGGAGAILPRSFFLELLEVGRCAGCLVLLL